MWATDDEKTIKYLNRAMTLGLEINILKLESYGLGEWELYLVKKNTRDYNLYIPKEVEFIVYEDDNTLSKVRGILRVIGGENLEDLSGAFMSLNLDTLDLSKLITHNCNTMNNVFKYSDFGKIIFGEDWDTSNVISMIEMFCMVNQENNNSKLELDLRNWDVSNVDDFKCIFKSANLKRLLINEWKTHAGAKFIDAFSYLKIDELDLTGMQLGKLKLHYDNGDSIYNRKVDNINKIVIDKSDYDLSNVKSFIHNLSCKIEVIDACGKQRIIR